MRLQLETREAADSTPGSPGSASSWRTPTLALSLAAACALSLVFPGDAPWIDDEPKIVLSALRSNEAGELARHGLVGSKGIVYGPAAIWIYQLLLLLSRDPVVLVILHAVLMSTATAIALFWLSRELRLWPWFAPIVALSPYLWFYNRLLWDNSFNIPLSALAVASYAAFLARRARAHLLLCAVCLGLAPLVHLMSLALVAPIAAHALLFEREGLRRHRWALLAVAAGAALLYWEYGKALYPQLRGAGMGPGRSLAPNGFAFPLLGGRFISALGLDYFFGPGWGRSPPMLAARALSGIAFPLVWAGMAMAARRVWQVRRGRPAATLDRVAGLALAILAAQVLLDGFTRTWVHPHYFNATWIAFVLFAWLAADALAKVRYARWLVPLHGGALGASTLLLVWLVHAGGGTRGIHYGPTLENQIEVAAEVERYAPESRIATDVPHYLRNPHALSTLRLLVGVSHDIRLPARELVIRYRSPDPRDGKVEVVAR